MAKPIHDRITAALAPDARATTVAVLIAELKSMHVAETAECVRQHAIAVAIGSDDATADAAAEAEVKASRKVTRLAGQIAELEKRHTELMNSEARRKREAEQAEILAERDAIVADLRARWQPLVDELAGLIVRVEESSDKCRRIRAVGPEEIARNGGTGLAAGHRTRIIEIDLPHLEYSRPLLRQGDRSWAMRP